LVLINLWYVAEWSKTVKDKPVKVKMLGRHFVLFRNGAGEVQCLSDVCLHRGGSLGNGWCTDSHRIACPYHGWEFGGDGRVEHIPSLGEGAEIPERARIDAYPVEERYGLVWVFLGDLPEEQRYPIPPLPEYEDPAWRMITTETTWQAEAARVVENGIDIAHASYVHPSFGKPETAASNFIENVERHDYWCKSDNVMYPPKFEDSWWRKRIRKEGAETHQHLTTWLPGFTIRMQVDLNEKMHLIMFDANTPVDEFETRTFMLQFRDFFKHPFFDRGSMKRLQRIAEEDLAIVEAASPNYLPDTLANEFSVKQDRFMGTWRALRRRHIEEQGWQIDTWAMQPHRGKKVFCIPSPQRQKNPQLDWVLEPVPLVSPVRAPAAAESR
jgi:phenylpropionate dioxygenase-like ring-hydroxylating dioxygenase large terminal subunit